MTFKQIIFQYLRTWLGTVLEAYRAGHCTTSIVASFYLAPYVVLRPSLISVTAVKYP